jgi:DNA-binding transcriptional LysR family regulator
VIEIRHLSHALILAEHRNFARAAKVLHMSQPALTRSIQMLEERMGVSLFERKRSGVEPTDAGGLMLKRAKAILGQAEDLMREVSGLENGESPELRVSAGPYAASMVLSPAVAVMLEKRPKLRFRLQTDHWVATIRKLRERRVDFAVCEASEVRDSDLEMVPLRRHRVQPVVRSGHPLLECGEVSIKQLLAWPWAMTARLPARLLSKFVRITGQGDTFEPAVQCEDLGVVKAVVQASDTVGFFPLALVEDDLASGRLVSMAMDEPWLATEFALFYLKDRTLSPVGAEFIEALQQADERLAERNQQLAGIALRRPKTITKGRKSSTSKAK